MFNKLTGARQKLSPGLRKVISNTGWLFADQILRMGVGLFVGVWVARYLGPEQYGIYNYAVAFVALFSAFATLGLNGIVVRDIVRDSSCKNDTLGTAFVLKLIGGVATLLVTVAVISLLRPDDSLTRWLVGITAAGLIFQAFDAITLWFQSQVQSKYVVYSKNAAFVAIALVKVALIRIQAPLITFAWASLAETVLSALGLVVAYRVNGHSLMLWRGNLERAQSLLNDSWPLILSSLAIYIQARIDQVMLGEMIGDSEVGQYSAAMRLIEVFGFIPVVIQSSVAPALTKAKAQNEILYYDRLLNLYRLMFILFLITAIPIFVFSNKLVVILLGNEYKAAGVLLSLFSIRLFFANFGVVKGLYIANENLFRYSLATAIAGTLVNVLFNYLLIPNYASAGAIYATIASFFTTTFFVDIFYPKVRKNLNVMLKAIVTPWQLEFK